MNGLGKKSILEKKVLAAIFELYVMPHKTSQSLLL